MDSAVSIVKLCLEASHDCQPRMILPLLFTGHIEMGQCSQTKHMQPFIDQNCEDHSIIFLSHSKPVFFVFPPNFKFSDIVFSTTITTETQSHITWFE